MQVHMDEMSRSMAALRVDKNNLEERLAVEKVRFVTEILKI